MYLHILLFLFGFFIVGTFGHISYTDILHLVLFGAPVAAFFAANAFGLVVDKHDQRKSKPCTPAAIRLTFFIVVTFFLALFTVYCAGIVRIPGIGIDEIKLGVGVIETVFSAYLSQITRRYL